ncbi:Uncharacterised protein [Klebsiella variicola]|nr:hypothetical protein [Klebsiella sp. RC2]VEC99993.1 Uncharacterised protein [Klebsiella variicola]
MSVTQRSSGESGFEVSVKPMAIQYDRPNGIKGRYLKIHNMLISVVVPKNHEVNYLWRLFNIIYIMRTNIVVAKL